MDQARQAAKPDDPRVKAALAEYMERVDRGEQVDREQFLASHADIADELGSFITTSEELARLASPARQDAEAQSISTRSLAGRDQETLIPQRVKGDARETQALGLPEQFGRYKILKPLGSGAMGTVYLAEDTQLHRKVALKTPSFEQDDTGELLERFYREARSAATIRQPHICPVFDVGEIGGKHFITMAFIEGRPLSAYIRPDKPQAERQTLVAVRKLALALQEAHDHNIIHRDLKPGNIMIDGKGEPIVMDFGLARKVHREDASRLTQSGMIVGSPAYMSPEQVEGDPDKLGPAADQYSLGVILYELLTGQLPFRGSVTGVIGAILTKEPTPVSELRAGIDPRIAALCARMMKKNASERYPSMKAVAETIAGILKEAPGEAMKETVRTVERPTKPQATQGVKTEKGVEAAAAVSITASNVTSLYEAAQKCLRKNDYEQVVQMLQQIPEQKRTDEVRALLAKARQLADEVAFLLAEIDEAERVNDNAVLTRATDELLKLKPKHHKALQIKDELSRYGKGKLWKPGGYTPDGRRIGEGSWIPWLGIAVGVIAFAATLWAVTIYLRSGSAIVRVQINDPNIEFTLQGQTITIEDNGEEIRISPEDENTLSISYGDATFTSDRFKLNKGDNPAVVVEVVDKTLAAKFGELSIGEWAVKQSDEPTPVPVPPTPPVATTSTVPADAEHFEGHSYKYFAERLSWKEAKQRCEQMGGHLPIVETAAENAFLNDMADKGFPSAGRNGLESVWLGATDEVKEGEWRWVDGSRAAYLNWRTVPGNAPGTQPNNNQGIEHYATLWLSRDPNRASGLWSDQPNQSTGQTVHFICEWDTVASGTPVAAASPVPADAMPFQGHSYKYFGEQLSWKVAKQRCEQMGGHLPIVETAAENAFLNDMADKGFSSAGRNGFESVWLGATDEAKEGEWRWIDGSRVAYTNWQGNQPNNKQNQEHYALLWLSRDPNRVSGQWSDQPNDSVQHIAHFICEWDETRSAAPDPAQVGWTDLFNGRDLTGWKGLVGDPVKRSQMSASELAAAQATADQQMRQHWKVADGVLEFDGQGDNLCTLGDYGDFELSLDWKIPTGGDSGIYLRGCPQVQIWDTGSGKPDADKGSGGLYNNKSNPRLPTVKADNPVGQWNTFFIRMVGDRVTVDLNGRRVVDNVVMENFFAPGQPMYTTGPIELQKHTGRLWFRNIRIRELSSATPAAAVNAANTPRAAQSLPRNEWIPLDPSAPRVTSWNWGKPLKNPENKKWENGVLSLDNAAVAFNQVQAKDVSFRAKVRFLEGNNMALVVRGEHGKGGVYALFDKQNNGQMYVAFLNTNKSKVLALKDDYFDFQVDAIGDQVSIQVNGQTVVRHRETQKLKAGHIEVTAYNARGMFKEMAVKILDEAPPMAAAATESDWTDLFNAQDLTGWVRHIDGQPVTSGWTVENGEIHLRPPGGGDIRSSTTYADFELEFEWKVASGANSGIFYRAGASPQSGAGPEYQVVDDQRTNDGKQAQTSAGSIFNISGSLNKTLDPAGQWNQGRVIARGNHLEHWLNGSKVAEAEIGSPQWNQAVAQSYLSQRPQFAKLSTGHVVLQDHGTEAWFRKLRIRALTNEAASASPAPAASDWTDLFNGRDLTGWTAPVLPNNWEVQGGVIVAKGTGLSALFANGTYDNFELELEYKLTSGCNSGIWIRAPNNTEAAFGGAKRAMSISLLDDASPKFANDIQDPSKRTGGLHAAAGPNPLPSAPAGAWNRLLIRAVGPQITATINGTQVLDVNTADHVARLPEHTGLARSSGYIGLEDNSKDGVEFRNIRIRPIGSPNNAEAAAAALQGTWTAVGQEIAGTVWTQEQIAEHEKTISFAGDTFEIRYRDRMGQFQVERGTYRLDSTHDPEHITMTGTNRDSRVFEFVGIDQLDGDQLRHCFVKTSDNPAARRPTSFSTSAGSGQFSTTYRRN